MTDAETAGHVYGNFPNYYAFHPALTRIELITAQLVEEIWKNHGSPSKFFILDVGCNDGDLSIELYRLFVQVLPSTLCQVYLLGVDLDEALICRANLKLSESDKAHIEFLCYDIMAGDDASLAIQTWSKLEGQGFNMVTAFSVTMWIHLHHHDDGLLRFLQLLSTVASTVLIEPQTWKSYRNAIKRMKKLDIPLPKHFTTIKYREHVDRDIEHMMLTECGYTTAGLRNLGTDDWGRPIQLYHRSIESSIKKQKTDNI
jgi:SAM-dependent methyltransferase